MKHSSQIILQLGLLLSFLMLESILFFIGCSIRGSEQITLQLLPLAVLTILFSLFNEWLSGRNLPVNALIFLNLAFCIVAALCGFRCILSEPVTTTVHIFQVIIPVSLVLCGFYYTWYPEKPQSLILAFDGLIAFFLIYLFLDMAEVLLPSDTLELSCLIIMGLVLLAIILIRISTDETHTGIFPKGFFPVLFLITGCLLLALGISLLISGQVRSVTDFFTMLLKYIVFSVFWVLGKISDILGIFFQWLMNLLPDAEIAMSNTEIPDLSIQELPNEETLITISPVALLIVLAVLVTIGLCWIFLHMRGKRMIKKTLRKKSGQITKTWTMPSPMELLRSLYRSIQFHIQLFQKRRTPAVLAFRIEQYGKRHGKTRNTGESVPAYLKRLSELLEYKEKPDLAKALTALADLVQEEYYSNTFVQVDPYLYQKIRSVF
ncbi:MAG: hypothetical protein IKV59_08830 [Lachnospiraceae bacterium]|nr:hypothetical protein [Lachnospiraceae bacterium]